MDKREKRVKLIMNIVEGLVILSNTSDCHEKGCENCSAHMAKAIRINGKITRCMFALPGLLMKEIDNCME